MPYIGRSTEAFGVRTRYTYTPSAGDTSVSGADVNGYYTIFDASTIEHSGSSSSRLISEEGEEIGKLSIGPSWDNTRYNPYDIKYTCDWD